MGLGLWIDEFSKTCIDVFVSFSELSAGCKSTKEIMMSSNLGYHYYPEQHGMERHIL